MGGSWAYAREMLPRRRAARVFLGGFALVALVHLVAQLAGGEVVADVTQVLLMPLLAGVLWCETSSPRGRLVTLVLVALGLSWLGDSAPQLTSGDAAFLVMIGFFLLAQVAYIAAFLPFRARSVLHVRRPLLLVYLAASPRSSPPAPRAPAPCSLPVLVYGACLGTMAVLSTGVNRLTAVGGALFLVSDGLIALDAFAVGFDLPAQGFWVMSTYLAAQVLIVAGVLLEDAGESLSPPPRRRMPSALGERTASVPVVSWSQRPRSRPMSSFMISLEPAQILVTRASRQARATRYSFMKP